MKKAFLTLLLGVAATVVLHAQDYGWGVGVRLGAYDSGVSAKYNFNSAASMEALLSFTYSNETLLTALYERNIPVIDRGFTFYYGCGAHIGGNRHLLLGADGIAGLEYHLPNVPLAFSLDYKPSLDLFSSMKPHFDNFGLGIKVTF